MPTPRHTSTAITVTMVSSFLPHNGDPNTQGNPAGVCILETPLSDSAMQAIATNIGASETSFVVREARGDYSLRWFTPTTEIALCGHGTLAAAHVLWSEGLAHDAFPIRFQTQSGLLQAVANGRLIALDFPALPISPKASLKAPLENALGLAINDAILVGPENDPMWIAVVENVEQVRQHQPNIPAIAALQNHGVILTAKGDKHYDIVSRYYAPGIGIPEDPVTGSIHCALAPYWAHVLGKKTLKAYQASSRGGELTLTLLTSKTDDAQDKAQVALARVTLEGEAANINTLKLTV
jgi:PhzF family phenazine biosynthesis protein